MKSHEKIKEVARWDIECQVRKTIRIRVRSGCAPTTLIRAVLRPLKGTETVRFPVISELMKLNKGETDEAED